MKDTPSTDERERRTEPPCGSNATHHHSQASSAPFPSFLRAAAAAHCTNNSTGCAPPTALPPFPAVFTSSRTTCLTAPLPPLAVSPADADDGGRLIFARKPISSSEWSVSVVALQRTNSNQGSGCMHACTSKVAQTEPLYESGNRTQTAELVSSSQA